MTGISDVTMLMNCICLFPNIIDRINHLVNNKHCTKKSTLNSKSTNQPKTSVSPKIN